MSTFRLILAGLRHHWRIHASVAAGVAAATAVITGALLIGDSVRGTLRHLTLDRLGQIDDVLLADRFFRSQLADELQSQADFETYFQSAVPAIVVEGTLENPTGEHHAQAGRVSVLGCDQRFWSLGTGGPQRSPGDGEIVLNEPLALTLRVKAGDEVLLRVGNASAIPADSALGRKTETIKSRRLQVSEVIASAGLGRFGLRPTQRSRYNAFTTPKTLQVLLEQPDKVNAVLIAGRGATPSSADGQLHMWLKPTLADYGFSLKRGEPGYVQFASGRMLIEPAAERAVERAFQRLHPQALFTYLANTIAVGDRQIPYSTITAIDFRSEPPLGPFQTVDGDAAAPLGDDEIALNAWAAEDLGAKPGDTVEITYFEPESTHGEVREKTVRLTLRAIIQLDGAAADPDLTPELKGVTDQASITDWNPPFPFDASRIRKKDEKYWDEHRATPKAFVSLDTGRRLWSSRFGHTTSIRFAAEPAADLAVLAKQIELEPASLGFSFVPVKRLGLAASAGTTPFNWLFLGLSFFIVAAALMLVSLLFRLGIERRAEELGVLSSVGLSRGLIAKVFAGEAAVVAAVGGLLGLVLAIAYAWLIIVALRTWWFAAVNTSSLALYVSPVSFLAGYLSGVLVSLATIFLTLRRMGRSSVRAQLAGASAAGALSRPERRWAYGVAATAAVLALGLGLFASRLSGEGQAGAFVGSGALILAACLATVFARLHSEENSAFTAGSRLTLLRLALLSARRNPTRSTLTLGLTGAATFLIVALSAFRLDPSAEGLGFASGSGGFALIAESDQPLHQDLNTTAGRQELSVSGDTDRIISGCDTFALRVQPGDDASCLNLYQPGQPRVLGVPRELVSRGGFAWAATTTGTSAERDNPWLHLRQKSGADEGLPVILDANTATYSMHLGLGDTFAMDDAGGRPLRLRVVALLKNSIFQGDLLMSEENFLKHFPGASGYRLFLIDTKGQGVNEVQTVLSEALGDYGFVAERSVDRLAEFLAVQNTYLSTFQSLGALGLLLGTFGLATAQLRSVLERRAEMALLRAAGFPRRLLARLVMLENGVLLLGGLAIGILAALVAVLPHWLSGGAAVPWLSLAATLAVVLLVGLAAGMIAVRAVTRADLIPALRGD